MIKLHTIFPVTISTSHIGRQITEEEINTVEKYKSLSHQNIGNYTSDENHILDKEFPEIRKFIQENIDEYVSKVIRPANPCEFYITQSWLNYTSNAQYHHMHNHPNSIISGAFYFSAGSGDQIILYNNKPSQFDIHSNQLDNYNADTCTIPVESGKLVMFPSYLMHSVPLFTAEYTRVSLAFNVFIRGAVGSSMHLTELLL